MRNATIQELVIADQELHAGPIQIEMNGASYSRFGDHDSDFYIDWLSRENTYYPQSYEQLAGVLRSGQHYEKALNLLYACADRSTEVLQAQGEYQNWPVRILEEYVIGLEFDRHYFRSLYWAIGYCFLGTMAFRLREAERS